MEVSKFRRSIIEKQKKEAIKLYDSGMSYREVAEIVGKSYTWVFLAVKERNRLNSNLTDK